MNILILILATWRISNLLVNEEGPYFIFNRFRDLIGVYYGPDGIAYGDNVIAEVFTCLWCLSIWIGLLITFSYWIIPDYTTYIMLPFALSTGAILIGEMIDNAT